MEDDTFSVKSARDYIYNEIIRYLTKVLPQHDYMRVVLCTRGLYSGYTMHWLRHNALAETSLLCFGEDHM